MSVMYAWHGMGRQGDQAKAYQAGNITVTYVCFLRNQPDTRAVLHHRWIHLVMAKSHFA